MELFTSLILPPFQLAYLSETDIHQEWGIVNILQDNRPSGLTELTLNYRGQSFMGKDHEAIYQICKKVYQIHSPATLISTVVLLARPTSRICTLLPRLKILDRFED
jgi:hypothetical protein